MQKLLYPNLWKGCIGAWCPSVQRFPTTQLVDYSANNRHGTLTNMDAASDWVASDGKVAIDFASAGVNEVISTPSITLGDEFTITVWLRTRSAGPTGYGRVVAGASDTTPVCYVMSNSTTSVGFYVNDTFLIATVPNTNNVFSCHALVFKSGMRKEVWSAGILRASTTQTATCAASTYHFGNRNFLQTPNFDGWLDDFRFYNRALTPSEIATLALRRGIAYEQVRNRKYKAAGGASTNRRRRIICGANC
jgi:hypothetical protein